MVCPRRTPTKSEMSTHWIVLVKWKTVIEWKARMREARLSQFSTYPYQYGSSQIRFKEILAGDVLWILATPRYDRKGKPSASARARPPAVMARLRVKTVCCDEPEDVRCEGLLPCDKVAHPSSEGWPILVIGEKDIEVGKLDPLTTTYPALYNAYSVMSRLQFSTKNGKRDLRHRLKEIENSNEVFWGRAGPYGRLAQSFQRLRKLTDSSANAMDDLHKRAVMGRRVFFSYRWADTELLAADEGKTRRQWIRELNRALDEKELVTWLDHHQLAPQGPDTGFLEELLSDAVRQATLFVAFVTPSYGLHESWSKTEWNYAGELQARLSGDTSFKNPIRRVALDLGGDLAELEDGIPFDVISVENHRIGTIANAISKHIV